MTNQQPDYSNPPEWATPEAWATVEKHCANARVIYERLREDLEKQHWGKYVLIDTASKTDRYLIGERETSLDQTYANDPSWENSVLVHIGYA